MPGRRGLENSNKGLPAYQLVNGFTWLFPLLWIIEFFFL